MTFSVQDLIALLRLDRVDERRFSGGSPHGGTPHIYGGQMVAQSIIAMGRTVHSEYTLHSVHGYFIRSGVLDERIDFDVDTVRDGRNFCTRSLRATQAGKLIYTGSASFQKAEGDHDRFERMPSVAVPESLESEEEFLGRQSVAPGMKRSFAPFFVELFERRSAYWRHPAQPGVQAPRNALWIRLKAPVGDNNDALLHQALVAYISDMDLMNTAMRPRGIGALDPAAHSASLDHIMWFHAPVRADQWFFYDLDGPCATRNRGLGSGAIYQHGYRVVTAMQEGLLRVQPQA